MAWPSPRSRRCVGSWVDSDDGDEVDGDDGDEGDAVGAARLARTAVAMVVVDEAHYVKNVDARRSRAVQVLVAGVERALFLTGTPMENRGRGVPHARVLPAAHVAEVLYGRWAWPAPRRVGARWPRRTCGATRTTRSTSCPSASRPRMGRAHPRRPRGLPRRRGRGELHGDAPRLYVVRDTSSTRGAESVTCPDPRRRGRERAARCSCSPTSSTRSTRSASSPGRRGRPAHRRRAARGASGDRRPLQREPTATPCS